MEISICSLTVTVEIESHSGPPVGRAKFGVVLIMPVRITSHMLRCRDWQRGGRKEFLLVEEKSCHGRSCPKCHMPTPWFTDVNQRINDQIIENGIHVIISHCGINFTFSFPLWMYDEFFLSFYAHWHKWE